MGVVMKHAIAAAIVILAASAFGGDIVQRIGTDDPGAADIYELNRPAFGLTATLPLNGGPPSINVRVRKTDSKVAVYAYCDRAVTWIADVTWTSIAQDTTKTAANSHQWYEIDPGFNGYDGDVLRVAVRIKESDGDLIETKEQTFTLDGPGTVSWHYWRSSYATATSAVTAGLLPNGTSAENAAFAHVYRDADGTDMKYGAISNAYPDSVFVLALQASWNGQYSNKSATTDDPIGASEKRVLLWYNLNRIAAYEGDRVAFASIFGTVGVDGAAYVDGLGFTVRMDTTLADTACAHTTSPRAWDPRFMATTLNKVDRVAGTDWGEAWSARDDHSDVGPRGSYVKTDVDGNSTWHGGDYYVIDVTDPVQQYLYDRRGSSPGPFVFMTDMNALALLSFGEAANCTGTPALIVGVVEGEDYTPAWGHIGVPVAFAVDDGDTSHYTWAQILQAYGYNQTEVLTGISGVDYSPATRNNLMIQDEYETLEDNGTDFALHSWLHNEMGHLTTERDFWAEMRHSWIDTVFNDPGRFEANPDDTASVDWADFVWTALDGSDITSTAAIQYLQAYGYRSSWTPGHATYAETGVTTYPAWDSKVNMYLLDRQIGQTIFGTNPASPFTSAQIQEEMGELVDVYYHDRGKAAIVIFVHDRLDEQTYANSGMNPDQLIDFCDHVAPLREIYMSTVQDIVNIRTSDQRFIVPEPSFAGSMYLDGEAWQNTVWMGARRGYCGTAATHHTPLPPPGKEHVQRSEVP
jgi:peptidoglycan/xylan/chitin deacetylase (PgdA/CDA1 family)